MSKEPPDAVAAAGVRHAPSGEGFVVEAFANKDNVGSLRYLEAGLPVFLADRLWNWKPLRFVGPSSVLAPVAAAAKPAPGAVVPPVVITEEPKLRIVGWFEKRPGLRLAIFVQVQTGSETGHEVVAAAARECNRQQAPEMALAATLEALARVPGLSLAAPTKQSAAPFARDPYAFVLYSRGLLAYLGLGGVKRSVESAQKWLVRALLIDPRVPETRRYLAVAQLDGGKPNQARSSLAFALDERPDYVPALITLAGLEKEARGSNALVLHERLLALDPTAWRARSAYGELLYEAGKFPEARRALEVVLQQRPDDAASRRILTLVLSSQRAGAALVHEFEEIVKLDPNNVAARLDLAAAYMNENRLADAANTYDSVLERQPRHKEALKFAGDLLRQQGQLEEAAKRYERLRRLAPDDPRPVFLLGALYHQAGNLAAAERMFTDAAQFPQLRAEAWSNLGAVMVEQGRAKEARWLLMKAAQSRPNKASIRYNYAVLLRALDLHADALNELHAALQVDPADPQITFAAGVVALRLGLLREAEDQFRATLALQPSHAGASHNLKLLTKVTGGKEEMGAAGAVQKILPLQKVN
ncbi:MAG: tetratricopeptide repeat protein [Deltaproteobacteria bacterium]|nr:tetratricopeptide repeat protein [Deltaproteobacteria bacterium]